MKLILKELTSLQVKKTKYFDNWNALYEVLDHAKVEILKKNFYYFYFAGAKNTGKTYMAILMEILTLEMDARANAVGLREFKTQAIKKLSNDFLKVFNLLQYTYGFTFRHKYVVAKSEVSRVVSKKDKPSNQKIIFDTFEKSASISGESVTNRNGYIGLVHFEEIVSPDIKRPATLEMKKIFDDTFNEVTKDIQDTIARSYEIAEYNHEILKISEAPLPFKIIYTYNMWNPWHPVAILTEHYIPEKEFTDFALCKYVDFEHEALFSNPELWEANKEAIKKSLLENHTFSKEIKGLDEETGIEDAVFARFTKFSLPMVRLFEKRTNKVLYDIRVALRDNNKHDLARTLGMTDTNENAKETVYNMIGYETSTWEKLNTVDLRRNYRNEYLMFGVDIDVGRQMTVALGLPFNHELETKNDFIYIPKIKTIPVKTKRDLKLYLKRIVNEIEEKYLHWNKIMPIGKEKKVFIEVDDNQNMWCPDIRNMLLENGIIKHFIVRRAEKHGHWLILKRQEYVQKGIQSNRLRIDETNIKLLDFMRNVERGVGGKRVEKGRMEILADWMNAMEYAIRRARHYLRWRT